MSLLDRLDLPALAREVTVQLDAHGRPADVLFRTAALHAGLVHTCSEQWPTAEADLGGSGLDLLMTHGATTNGAPCCAWVPPSRGS